MTGWSRKPRLAGGDGRFANQAFTFIKVSFLFADMHDNFGRTRGVLVIPPTCRSGTRIHPRRIRWILFATAYDQCKKACTYSVQQTARVHGSGYLCGVHQSTSTLKSILTALAAVSIANGVRPRFDGVRSGKYALRHDHRASTD